MLLYIFPPPDPKRRQHKNVPSTDLGEALMVRRVMKNGLLASYEYRSCECVSLNVLWSAGRFKALFMILLSHSTWKYSPYVKASLPVSQQGRLTLTERNQHEHFPSDFWRNRTWKLKTKPHRHSLFIFPQHNTWNYITKFMKLAGKIHFNGEFHLWAHQFSQCGNWKNLSSVVCA